ncbi:hypothetical protein [Streptomyces sp. NPDC051214]|uniref:hypothetical protein n=1 Tax=Streptomyces sp. NPDC051214 TaxID=3155282 RepID=UPI00341A5A5A
MSNDYAALITTFIVAVIAVGTIQVYTFSRRWGDTFTAEGSKLIDARQRLLELFRQGHDPTSAEMEAAGMGPRWYLSVLLKGFPPYLATGLWVLVCAVLVFVQAHVLRWAAMENKPKGAKLAETSFWVVVIAVVILVAEGLIRGLLEAQVNTLRVQRRLAPYSRTERHVMEQALKEYRRTGQLPAPSASHPPSTPPTP